MTSSTRTHAIEVRGVTRRYGEVQALGGVDLTVDSGEVFAVLGPNGAGKTTLVEILEGIRKRDSGTIEVLGEDPLRAPRRWHTRVGAVLQLGTETGELTVREMITAYAAYYPKPLDVSDLLEALDLGGQADRRIRQLSGGQRRRLDLALGLIGDPELLFLDEPTTGLDPEVRIRIWDFVSSLAEKGMTIVLTTHYLGEAEQLADRVAVLVGGEVVATGPPAELGGSPKTEITFRRVGPIAEAALPLSLTATSIEDSGSTVKVLTEASATTVGELAAWASGLGAELAGLTMEKKNLERTYLDLIAGFSKERKEVSS